MTCIYCNSYDDINSYTFIFSADYFWPLFLTAKRFDLTVIYVCDHAHQTPLAPFTNMV